MVKTLQIEKISETIAELEDYISDLLEYERFEEAKKYQDEVELLNKKLAYLEKKSRNEQTFLDF